MSSSVVRRAAAFTSQFTMSRSSSTWASVQQGPADAILGISEAFKADSDPNKINLGVGAYRDGQGKPYVLSCVKQAEKRILERNMDKEYTAITGVPGFGGLATKLAYGPDAEAISSDRIAVTQSLSGTGALRIGAAFLERFYTSKTIFVPTPTWANHHSVFKDARLEVKQYRYYNKDTIRLDIDGMLEDLMNAPPKSIILLHACAHNPTGVDPTHEQWKQISEACHKSGHFVFFDMAYQGFASGDTDRDAFALRYFVQQGHSIALAQSFAKNMGLYGERVGAFSLLCDSAEEKKRVDSQIKIIVRAMYSNPPVHGARIASEILKDPGLNAEWLEEVKGMADRIHGCRSTLRNILEGDLKSSRDWSHITSQIGMFCFTGLAPDQVEKLTKEHHVYLTKDGRVSMAGVTDANVRYLAEAIHKVTC